MTKTNYIADLGKSIEQLIEQHLAASRAAAQDAVARAFAATASAPAGERRQVRSTPGRKRPPADIAALGARFYEAVCAKPGETMAVLAGDVGASARELHRSVTLLRRVGRVRAVGSRNHTRYFPMASSASS